MGKLLHGWGEVLAESRLRRDDRLEAENGKSARIKGHIES